MHLKDRETSLMCFLFVLWPPPPPSRESSFQPWRNLRHSIPMHSKSGILTTALNRCGHKKSTSLKQQRRQKWQWEWERWVHIPGRCLSPQYHPLTPSNPVIICLFLYNSSNMFYLVFQVRKSWNSNIFCCLWNHFICARVTLVGVWLFQNDQKCPSS